MSEQPQGIIVYRSQYDYAMQNDIGTQEAYVKFMGFVILVVILYVGWTKMREKYGSKRLGPRR